MKNTHTIKNAIRNKYAWPGGYPLFLVMSDGAALCVECGHKEWKRIAESIHKYDYGWAAVAAEANWEDGELYCCNCNKQIESAYN